MTNTFQREGSISNAHVGNEFELLTKKLFAERGIFLEGNIKIKIGLREKKSHRFDLGSVEEKIIVECKSHTWTKTGNTPSAKMTTWEQAMFYFLLAPEDFRKIFVVLKNEHPKKNETLAEYFIRLRSNLIPEDVEIWELDVERKEFRVLSGILG